MRYHAPPSCLIHGVRLAAAMVCLAVTARAPGADRIETGRLEAGDVRLSSGEYFDEFPLEGEAGTVVILQLHSTEYDSFIQMSPKDRNGPAGDKVWHNNDMRSGNTDACIGVVLPADGEYTVFVTSATANETGRYELSITVVPQPTRTESGSLTFDDRKLTTGEYCDYYDFDAKAGELWVIDLSSSDYNTYLFGRSNDDTEFRVDNDDAFSDMHRSQVVMSIPRDGRYFVGVTSAQPAETGAYTVTMTTTEAEYPATSSAPLVTDSPAADPAAPLGIIGRGASELGQSLSGQRPGS